MQRIRLRLKSTIIVFLGLFTFICARTSYVLCAPSDVYIDTNNILTVTKPNDIPSPFVIKGVSWSPATRAPQEGPNPLNPSKVVQYGFFFEYWDIPGDRNPPGHEVLNYWLKNQISQHYLTDIPLIRQMNANTVRIYHSLGSSVEDYAQVATEIKNVLDEFYQNGIMVIMTVAMSKTDLDTERYLQVVNAYKDHPAILMWSLGNEWNLNKFYGFEDLDPAAAAVDKAAQKIKAIDSHHPVSSVLGDVFDNSNIGNCDPLWTIADILQRCPSVDVWGLNVYRGNTFGNLFEQWDAQFINQLAKPFYVSEFGIDSLYSTAYASNGSCPTRADNVIGDEDRQMQADIDSALWREIKSRLSLENNNELCLGGLLHEFNDELWKAGSYHVGLGGLVDYNNPPENHSYDDYNPEGFELIGGSPDNILNEEHFGLVTADRIPKLAYSSMKKEFNVSSQCISIAPSSGSSPAGAAVTFTTTYSDSNGWQDIKSAYFLVNTSATLMNCLYAYYDQNTNKLYLRSDANTKWKGGFAPGSTNIIGNSYAKINCSKTTVSGSGNTLTINWKVTFTSTFKGIKNRYLKVKDDCNAATGWVKKGTWTIK